MSNLPKARRSDAITAHASQSEADEPGTASGRAVPTGDTAATQVLAAGGNGKDGVLSLTGAEGTSLVQTARGAVGNGALKHVELQVGGGAVAGAVQLFDREGNRAIQLSGSNGSMTLRSQIALQGKDNQGQIILGATSNRSTLFMGAPERPGFIQLTTGGNPGPTIELDGERNSLLFLNKGSRSDSVLELNGNSAAATVGGTGRGGTVSVRGADAKPAVELRGSSASVLVGGNGRDGTVSVRGADGQPLLELLGRANESVMGLGQANRPGRISMYSAKGESIRLDAAAGDIMLRNADCAEEFDVATADAEPGTVMVLAADGRLVASAQACDTRVVGVVSGAGAYRPALVLDRRDTDSPRLPIALMGKVYCWVDATDAPIATGDLLTTSDVPGHAMKALDLARAAGAIVGKALAPLASGRQLIPVLVTGR